MLALMRMRSRARSAPTSISSATRTSGTMPKHRGARATPSAPENVRESDGSLLIILLSHGDHGMRGRRPLYDIHQSTVARDGTAGEVSRHGHHATQRNRYRHASKRFANATIMNQAAQLATVYMYGSWFESPIVAIAAPDGFNVELTVVCRQRLEEPVRGRAQIPRNDSVPRRSG